MASAELSLLSDEKLDTGAAAGAGAGAGAGASAGAGARSGAAAAAGLPTMASGPGGHAGRGSSTASAGGGDVTSADAAHAAAGAVVAPVVPGRLGLAGHLGVGLAMADPDFAESVHELATTSQPLDRLIHPPEDVEPSSLSDLYRYLEGANVVSSGKIVKELEKLNDKQLSQHIREVENRAFALNQDEEEELRRVRELRLFDTGDGDEM